MNRLKRVVLHPYLMAITPILALLANNVGQVVIWSTVRTLVVSLFGAVVLTLGLRAIVHHPIRAGLLVTLFFLLFFTYGHVYNLVEDAQIGGLNLGRHRFLLAIWLAALFLGSSWILRYRGDLVGVNQAANLFLLLGLVFPIFQIAFFEGQSTAVRAGSELPTYEDTQAYTGVHDLRLPTGKTAPDIYYIILDAYARDDTLENILNYDNQPFLDGLKSLGFYVARCSQSNYSSTQISLASSLNLSYLDGFGAPIHEINTPAVLNSLIQHNLVRQELQKLGYRMVAVESGFSPTEWRDADVYLSPRGEIRQAVNLWGGVNPFESQVFHISAGLFVYEARPWMPARVRSFLDAAYMEHRDRILFSLAELEKIPALPGPKFVFVHIVAPHEPFVFGPNGEIVGRNTPFSLNNDWDTKNLGNYRRGYRGQLKYLNSRVEIAVQSILASSQTPPVIIIQGDHGTLARVSSMSDRMRILNAYYLPDAGGGELYESISPVNSFRVLFNTYFGGKLELLADTAYFYDDKRSQFLVTPDQRPGCEANNP